MALKLEGGKSSNFRDTKEVFSEKGKVMSNIPVNLRTYTKMLKQCRSLLSRSLQSAKWGDGFESQAAFSTSLQDFAVIGNANVRVFAPYTIYKGKASLSISPVLQTFSDIDGLKVNRRGSMMLTFCPAIGERKYDWEKRQKFALSPTEVGSLISMGAHDASEFYHDPSMKSRY
ncbi:single-stranded DNA-bindig protein WHY2, mitochondrial [Gossypium australe]|uniref:Single-stranded DNA-bindig protein WHY2, mitochondrial n=1 Tax=Gossypium australe TaxID=47621 RepID=A0A5B6VK89_9ROSI|nr:single-stranded DNA-bindig protein WHY2, mitochondrial [Gossypium australe]